MAIARQRDRSPYGEVLHRIRLLEPECRVHERRLNLETFGALADVLEQLAASFERTHDPLEWRFTVATVSRRSAEALILRRARTQPRARTRGPG